MLFKQLPHCMLECDAHLLSGGPVLSAVHDQFFPFFSGMVVCWKMTCFVIAESMVDVDAVVLRAVYGDMHQIVTTSTNQSLLPHSMQQALCGATARAGGLAVAGLVAGTLLGSALQSWLRVDIIPIFVRLPRCLCPLAPDKCAAARHRFCCRLLTKLGCACRAWALPGCL